MSVVEGVPDFDFLRDGRDTVHAPWRLSRSPLLRVAADVPRESHNAVLRRDADVRRIDARIPLELISYILLQAFGHS